MSILGCGYAHIYIHNQYIMVATITVQQSYFEQKEMDVIIFQLVVSLFGLQVDSFYSTSSPEILE